MKLSVVFTTYNSPVWLEKVLWGFYYQTFKDFELIIADDGSTNQTKLVIENFQRQTNMHIRHVWQEDQGFQKTRILNKALALCSCDYVVFTDGDCIPRADFLEVHHQQKAPGRFLSGGYFKLPMNTSWLIEPSHIQSGAAFKIDWLVKHGLKPSRKVMKLNATGLKQKWLNLLTPAKASWNGHNASAWRTDLFNVNGFDERMQYGGEDRELGERLINAGIKGKQIRYSAICLHLDHARGYVEPHMLKANLQVRKTTKQSKLTKTAFGMIKA